MNMYALEIIRSLLLTVIKYDVIKYDVTFIF